MMQFKDKVIYVRKKLNISQQELAELLHLDHSTVNKWENGVNEPQPRKEQEFYKFCESSGIYFDALSKLAEQLKALNTELFGLEQARKLIENRILNVINEVTALLDKGT